MDFLLPLAIIGFIISIYQISAESKKRNFTFKFGWLDKLFLGVVALVLILLIFAVNFWSDQETEIYTNISLSINPFVYVIGKSNGYHITYSFLYSILAFVVSVFLIRSVLKKLNSTVLKQKEDFVANSLDKLGKQQYSEVAADLELFHNDLLKSYKISKNNYYYSYAKYIANQLKKNYAVNDYSSGKVWFEILFEDLTLFNNYKQNQEKTQHIFRNIQTKRSSIQKLSNRFNFNEKQRKSYCQLIDNYYYELTENNVFLEYVAMNNTDLMFMLLDNKLPYIKEDIWSVIGTELISNEKSKLYNELRNKSSRQQKILDFLFDDAEKCEQWLVWMPIGEYVIHHLREQGRKEVDEYNYYEEYYEERRNDMPLYTGINFFDFMINQALRQNIHNHFWLMYFKHWVEHILHNISYEDHEEAEFSNMYEYCLYLIVDCLRDWISYVKKDDYTPKNDLIIEYSIKTIVNVMQKISSSLELRDAFKNNLRQILIQNYFELAAHYNQEKMAPYVAKYKEAIKNNTCLYPGVNQSFIDFLKYPVEHYRDRTVWDRGIYYSAELQNDFMQFLDLLHEENI